MTAQKIWFKLTSPQETSWIKLSLKDVDDVNDLKKAIKTEKPVDLKDYDADRLILEAKKNDEDDDQAKELDNPEQSIESIQQHFGNNFRIIVSVPAGK